MSFIGLVSDSTASLSAEFVAQHGIIRVIPLYIKVGEEVYRDGIDITSEQFYERLPHSPVLPTTSQPSVGDFLDVYRQLVEQGATAIISVHLSSGLSGTINSATLAKEQISGVPIEIIDMRCVAASQLFAVEAGVKALECGADLQQAVAVVQRVVQQQKTVFSLDTLEYLYKGGRIGGAAALVGSLLQFRPLLYFRDGKIDVLERARKSSRALVRMVEVMAEWLGAEVPVRALVMHAAAPDRASALADLLPRYLKVADIRITTITPVLGAHSGNGTVGLCCCPLSLFQAESS